MLIENDDLFIDEEDVGFSVSTEALSLPYDIYFRRFGVRRLSQLSSPLLNDTSKLNLPRGSLLLYLADDETDIGISQNHILLKDTPRLIYVNHNVELASREGFAKRNFIQPTALLRDYLRKNRKTRILKDLERVDKDDKIILVENFAMLNRLWRYRDHPLTKYYRWKNIQNTLWTRASAVSRVTNRNQYLFINLPDLIPTVSQFKRAELNANRMSLEPFNDDKKLTLLDLWNWLGDNRETSTMSELPPESYDKIHLVFVVKGVWSVVNLGLINEWRKAGKEDGEVEEESDGTLSATSMQRRFLRYIVGLSEYNNLAAKTADPIVKEVIKDEVIEAENKPEVNKSKLPDKDDVIKDDIKNIEINKVDSEKPIDKLNDVVNETKPDRKITIGNVSKVVGLGATKTVERNKKIQMVGDTDKFDNEFEHDLNATDHLFKDETDEEIKEAINVLPPLEKGIMSKADELAEEGLISAAQYRRIEALSVKYKTLPNPHGEGTLEDLATITSNDLAMPKIDKLPDDPAILDKSMLDSTIEEMDRKYNKEILNKDIAATVLNIHKAGIAVTKFDVEHIQDAVNDYNSYTVKVNPVNGNPSLIRFKIPNIDDDGSYLCNSVRCKLRKQRVDCPIRKVKDNKVALTSYYSKLFVTRSDKVVNNYNKWLYKNIILKFEEENSPIKKLIFSNSWDNNIKVPRIYSCIGRHFKSFTYNDKFFFFDYENRHEHFGKERVEALENNGRVVVGSHNNLLIVIDNNNEFILIDNDKETSLGNIVDILNLDESKSPIELCEITILNKTLPLGIVLSYLLGFNNVLKLSKVNVKEFTTGDRIKIEDNEFIIKFIDSTLVFDKRDKTAVLLFGGFHKYRDFIKRYSLSTFNKKDIYYILLSSYEIGLRYIRELDLLNDMWVDPITEGILKDMGEPTQFIPLLFRSLELLLDDWSPDESDMKYQRIRGYERFSGFVYQEIVRAVRSYNVQSAAITANIDIHPEAVWREIDKDVSKYLVQESNPIHNLKEKETVTFAGSGGRSAETMTRRSRVYHKNDLGVISESSPDNKSVGAIAYLTPNAKFNSIRGTTDSIPVNEIENSSLLSTSALISPASDTDD